MKRLLFAAVAAVGLGVGVTPSTAQAAWVYRPCTKWDSSSNQFFTVLQPFWVPDYAPACSIARPCSVPVCYPQGGYWNPRLWYYHQDASPPPPVTDAWSRGSTGESGTGTQAVRVEK
jgi:hypothetical protein